MLATYPRVAIIGTAGRREDGARLTRAHFDFMIARAEQIIRTEWGLFDPPHTGRVTLVSGGAAWADHVAVHLFRKLCAHDQPPSVGLQLYLPAVWDEQHKQYKETAGADDRRNAGGVSNHYHRTFSHVCGIDSLGELHALRAQHIRDERVLPFMECGGFHSRNSAVAYQATHVIAFTFGEGDAPKPGGTFDTWRKCARCVVKKHVTLPRDVPRAGSD